MTYQKELNLYPGLNELKYIVSNVFYTLRVEYMASSQENAFV